MKDTKVSKNQNNKNENERKKKKSVIDYLYVKLLRDSGTNFIIVVIAFVFIVWMVIPLSLVLSGAVYFNEQWSGAPIMNVFTDPIYFNFQGTDDTQFARRTIEEIGGPAQSVVILDDIAFIAERGQGIEILNISTLDSIREIAQIQESESTYNDLKIKDNLLYTTAGINGFEIYNISNINNDLSPIAKMEGIANSTNYLTISNDLVFLDINGEGFSIIDVTDVNKPVILANVSSDTSINNVAIQNNYVFATGYYSGIKVFNVTDSNNPEFLHMYGTFPGLGTLRTQDIKIVDDKAFVAMNTGFTIFNISDPLNISLIAEYPDIPAYGVDISGNYAYVTFSDYVALDYGIKIIDFSDTENLELLGSFSTISYITQDIHIDESNNLVFLAQEKGGLHILDTSNLSNIIKISEYDDTEIIAVITLSGKDRGVVLNTIILGIATTIFSAFLGTALAFILARYEFPGKRLVSLLALAPLIIPPFISGMGFRLLLGPQGFLNNLFLIPVFQTKLILTGFAAICFVQTSHFYALVYLNAFSSFVNIDPSMEESAENLGAGRLKLFFSVTLPLALPGIGAGSILVLILSMEDVGTPIIFAAMGDNFAKNYLTYYVFENYARAGSAVITPEVCVLGAILLIIALAGFFMIRRYVSLRKYAMISKGRAGEYRISKAKWKLLIIYPFLILLFTFSLLVHVGVFLMSIMENLGVRTLEEVRFTLENYKLIFTSSIYNIPPFVLNTLVYSVLATMLIIVLGSLAAYVISRREFRGKNIIDALVTLPIAIPGIVLAIGFYRTFDWSGIASRNPNWFTKLMADFTTSFKLDPFIGVAVTLLIMSYTVRKFPFTVRSAYAGLQQTDPILEEASFNLGAGRIQTFAKITIPLISLNVFAGALVSFLYCLSEVSTTIFLIFESSAGTITWYMAWNPLKFQIFCALGVLLMILQIISLFVTNIILGARTEAITGI